MARIDPLSPIDGNPEALAAFTALPEPSQGSADDPNDPRSDNYAERSTLHASTIGALSVETLGRPIA